MATAEEIVLELQRELVLLGARVDYLETLEKGAAAAAQPTPIFLTGFEHGVPVPSASGGPGGGGGGGAARAHLPDRVRARRTRAERVGQPGVVRPDRDR